MSVGASSETNESRAEALLRTWVDELSFSLANGSSPSINRVAMVGGVSWHTAKRALLNLPPSAERGRPQICDDEVICWLEDAIRRQAGVSTQDFCDLLLLELGVDLSRSRMNWVIKHRLGASLVKAQTRTVDSLTDESALRLLLFLDEVSRIEPQRLRFYDQCNVSYSDLLMLQRRKLPGDATPVLATPTCSGPSFSFFGITACRTGEQAVFFQSYENAIQNGQSAEEHVSFIRAAVEQGALSVGDVIVTDNWAAHHSSLGNVLKAELVETLGVTMIFIPPKMSW